MSKRKKTINERIEHRLNTCLAKYDEDKKEGKKYLMRLIISEKLRALHHSRLPRPMKEIEETDIRYLVAKRVNKSVINRARIYKEQQYNMYLEILHSLE